jgi:hypothetical protein
MQGRLRTIVEGKGIRVIVDHGVPLKVHVDRCAPRARAQLYRAIEAAGLAKTDATSFAGYASPTSTRALLVELRFIKLFLWEQPPQRAPWAD